MAEVLATVYVGILKQGPDNAVVAWWPVVVARGSWLQLGGHLGNKLGRRKSS